MTTDLRVVKTKETIKRGFLACIDKQYFSKLTIAEITKEMQMYYEDTKHEKTPLKVAF